ncbi:MAG: sigma 54-interacting transcriptional regulator [Acidobacteriota bacterium]
MDSSTVPGGQRGTPRPDVLRELRNAVAAAASGKELDAPLEALGLKGLTITDGEGRDFVRLGDPLPSRGEVQRRALDAGGARFELALTPPVAEEVSVPIALVLEALLYRSDERAPRSDFSEGWRRVGVVTADAAMREPFLRLQRFAPQPVTVLVLGESGSGKEAAARAVHTLSRRPSGPFVSVNVPAIPAALLESELFGHARGAFTGAERDRRGLLEEATGGTIFFDEIGDLSVALQSKLLRALQEREIRRVGENRGRAVDVRVVSATSRDLAREVEGGRFREDLYYRLHVATISLPPLAKRGRDAVLLARHFLDQYAKEYGRGVLRLTPEAQAAVLAHRWPGNVRELQNAISQAAALAERDGAVSADLLPASVRRAARPGVETDYRSRVAAHRRGLVREALERSGGNRSRAARDLGLSRQALLYLIKDLGVPAARR